jgi:hypothetical protein
MGKGALQVWEHFNHPTIGGNPGITIVDKQSHGNIPKEFIHLYRTSKRKRSSPASPYQARLNL